MAIDPSRSLAELVVERPAAARVLERLGLDYCCGGKRSLADACAAEGLDPETVARFLERDLEPAGVEHADWSSAPIAELCEHIVEEHHARLRWELPRLTALAETAASVHGDALPALRELRDELLLLRIDLEGHIADEEENLFPALVRGETFSAADVAELEREHDEAGERLRRLRELGGGYAVDGALCNTHRALLEGLHGLELDVHQHVHEENNVLFPRALALAQTA